MELVCTGVLYLVTCPCDLTLKGARQGMPLGCVLCPYKRLLLFSCKQQPLRHQLPLLGPVSDAVPPGLIDIGNSRPHHSKQTFTEKIYRRIDCSTWFQEGGLLKLCSLHRNQVYENSRFFSLQTMQSMGNKISFLHMNTQKCKKKNWVDIYDEHN